MKAHVTDLWRIAVLLTCEQPFLRKVMEDHIGKNQHVQLKKDWTEINNEVTRDLFVELIYLIVTFHSLIIVF